jgi:hypothetical protein
MTGRLFKDLPQQAAPAPNLAKARAAWGDDIPDWMLIFASECDRTSVRAVAERLRYSPSVASQILSKTYAGRVDKVEAAVRGAFMGSTVQCPVLGELAVDKCLYHQGRKLAVTNPTRVMLSRTCPTCPNFKKAQPASQTEE